MAQLDGSTYALPNDVNPDAFWHDKQALAQAGITEDPAELAAKDQWTTQAFFSMTRKLAEAGMTGAAFWNYWSTTNSIIESQAGPVYTDNAYTANTNPAAVEAVQQWADRFASGVRPSPTSCPQDRTPTPCSSPTNSASSQGRYTVATIEGAGNSIDDYDVVRWPTSTAPPPRRASPPPSSPSTRTPRTRRPLSPSSPNSVADGQTQRLSNPATPRPRSPESTRSSRIGQACPRRDPHRHEWDEGFANYQVEAVVPDLSNTIANDYMLPIYQGKLTAQEGLDAIAKIVK